MRHNSTFWCFSVKLMGISFVLCLLSCYSYVNGEYTCPKRGDLQDPCKCERNGTIGVTISCDGTNLAIVSLALKVVKKPIETLTIQNVPAIIFSGPIFQDHIVYNLNVIDCGITKLNSSVFDPISRHLKSVDLSGNHLNSLEEIVNSVESFKNLTRLVLNRNGIKAIPSKSLAKLKNLRDLLMANNSINKLTATSFTGLTNLETLDLSGNQLNKIERNVFRETKKTQES